MKKRIVCFTVLMLVLITAVVFAGTVNLPRTGQTKCYDKLRTEIPCVGTGQDGDIQAGVPWPEPRFTTNTDTTIIDNLTGLIWAPNGNIMPTRNTGWDTDGTVNDGKVTWQHALDYVAKLNAENYLNHNDWRLPNVNELESLINANEANNSIWLNSQGFTNVQPNYYWSSTSLAINPLDPFIVGMWGGVAKCYWHMDPCFVWAVRGGQDNAPAPVWKTGQTISYAAGDDGDLERGVAWPVPRFTDHGNGTVTDNLTGLMWTQKASIGQANWEQAMNYVAGMNVGTYPYYGYHDWRLPNRKELHSLTDYSRFNYALPEGQPFINLSACYYWSSTSYAEDPEFKFIVYILSGELYIDHWGQTDSNCTWPVRGPEPTLITLSSFTATPSGRSVILAWTTASEIDNAGFNLYRAETENAECVKINSSLIPAHGSPTQGTTYKYVDENMKNRTTYYYKLEDIDLSGKSTMHGPVSAEPRRLGRD